MSWLLAAAGLAAMTQAFARGDLDETMRQGELAGPAVVEQALAAHDRATVLAGIAAAPAVTDAAELLPALARVASGPDRRTAVPAAGAARTIAHALAAHPLPDDVAPGDVDAWRADFAALAACGDRFVEVRVAALDAAASLAHAVDPAAIGFDLDGALHDRDPAVRLAAASLVPDPAPDAARAPLAAVVIDDADRDVALGAAQALCASPNAVVIAALGPRGLARIRELAGDRSDPVARDARRCVRR